MDEYLQVGIPNVCTTNTTSHNTAAFLADLLLKGFQAFVGSLEVIRDDNFLSFQIAGQSVILLHL